MGRRRKNQNALKFETIIPASSRIVTETSFSSSNSNYDQTVNTLNLRRSKRTSLQKKTSETKPNPIFLGKSLTNNGSFNNINTPSNSTVNRHNIEITTERGNGGSMISTIRDKSNLTSESQEIINVFKQLNLTATNQLDNSNLNNIENHKQCYVNNIVFQSNSTNFDQNQKSNLASSEHSMFYDKVKNNYKNSQENFKNFGVEINHCQRSSEFNKLPDISNGQNTNQPVHKAKKNLCALFINENTSKSPNTKLNMIDKIKTFRDSSNGKLKKPGAVKGAKLFTATVSNSERKDVKRFKSNNVELPILAFTASNLTNDNQNHPSKIAANYCKSKQNFVSLIKPSSLIINRENNANCTSHPTPELKASLLKSGSKDHNLNLPTTKNIVQLGQPDLVIPSNLCNSPFLRQKLNENVCSHFKTPQKITNHPQIMSNKSLTPQHTLPVIAVPEPQKKIEQAPTLIALLDRSPQNSLHLPITSHQIPNQLHSLNNSLVTLQQSRNIFAIPQNAKQQVLNVFGNNQTVANKQKHPNDSTALKYTLRQLLPCNRIQQTKICVNTLEIHSDSQHLSLSTKSTRIHNQDQLEQPLRPFSLTQKDIIDQLKSVSDNQTSSQTTNQAQLLSSEPQFTIPYVTPERRNNATHKEIFASDQNKSQSIVMRRFLLDSSKKESESADLVINFQELEKKTQLDDYSVILKEPQLLLGDFSNDATTLQSDKSQCHGQIRLPTITNQINSVNNSMIECKCQSPAPNYEYSKESPLLKLSKNQTDVGFQQKGCEIHKQLFQATPQQSDAIQPKTPVKLQHKASKSFNSNQKFMINEVKKDELEESALSHARLKNYKKFKKSNTNKTQESLTELTNYINSSKRKVEMKVTAKSKKTKLNQNFNLVNKLIDSEIIFISDDENDSRKDMFADDPKLSGALEYIRVPTKDKNAKNKRNNKLIDEGEMLLNLFDSQECLYNNNSLSKSINDSKSISDSKSLSIIEASDLEETNNYLTNGKYKKPLKIYSNRKKERQLQASSYGYEIPESVGSFKKANNSANLRMTSDNPSAKKPSDSIGMYANQAEHINNQSAIKVNSLTENESVRLSLLPAPKSSAVDASLNGSTIGHQSLSSGIPSYSINKATGTTYNFDSKLQQRSEINSFNIISSIQYNNNDKKPNEKEGTSNINGQNLRVMYQRDKVNKQGSTSLTNTANSEFPDIVRKNNPTDCSGNTSNVFEIKEGSNRSNGTFASLDKTIFIGDADIANQSKNDLNWTLCDSTFLDTTLHDLTCIGKTGKENTFVDSFQNPKSNEKNNIDISLQDSLSKHSFYDKPHNQICHDTSSNVANSQSPPFKQNNYGHTLNETTFSDHKNQVLSHERTSKDQKALLNISSNQLIDCNLEVMPNNNSSLEASLVDQDKGILPLSQEITNKIKINESNSTSITTESNIFKKPLLKSLSNSFQCTLNKTFESENSLLNISTSEDRNSSNEAEMDAFKRKKLNGNSPETQRRINLSIIQSIKAIRVKNQTEYYVPKRKDLNSFQS